MNIQYLILIILSLLLVNCSNNTYCISNKSTLDRYIYAQHELQNNDYESAITDFKKLNDLYPYGPFSQQIKLNLIYAYYKISDLESAQISIDNFIHLYPNHPNMDYVLYIHGLTNIEMAKRHNFLLDFIKVDYSINDPMYIEAAFHDFILLIKKYPNSVFAVDAIKRLIFLKNCLAEHDLSIVKYYNKCGAYIAVIHRVEQMLYNFQDTEYAKKALFYMKESYHKLGLYNQENEVVTIIKFNHLTMH